MTGLGGTYSVGMGYLSCLELAGALVRSRGLER